MNQHDQTKGRIFRAAVGRHEAYRHMAALNRIPGKDAYVTKDDGVMTLFWTFLTPKQADLLRGLAITLGDETITEAVSLVESVQSL